MGRNPRWPSGKLIDKHIGKRPVAEVAAAAGIKRTNVYNWLSGTRAPARALVQLQDALGFSEEELKKALRDDIEQEASEKLAAQREAERAARTDPDGARDGLAAGTEVTERRKQARRNRGRRGTGQS
jgi:hypothetical protein